MFDETVVVASANVLIDMLNDGRPVKEYYKAQYYVPHGQYWVFMAANKDKKPMFNVLDNEGKIPSGLSANWRTLQHIKGEIGL